MKVSKQFNSAKLGSGLAQQLQKAQDAVATSKKEVQTLQQSKSSANAWTNSSSTNIVSSNDKSQLSNLMSSLLGTVKTMSDKTTTKTATTSNKSKTKNPKNCAPTPPKCPPTPPKCPPPPPPPVDCEPPPPPPPPPPTQKVFGAAGLYGDPKFSVFTPGLDANIYNALQDFDSGIQKGQTVTILNDPDKGGFAVTGTGVQVDPANANSIGIGTASFQSGTDKVTINGDGSLLINGTAAGNINTDTIGTRTLANGMKLSVSNEIDNAAGGTAKRFVITNGEYKVTAAVRKPHADSAGYLDMNFEETTANAADNAIGYTAPNVGAGIPDLLRLEPGDGQLLA